MGLLLPVLIVAGCAPAIPVLGAGSTTPERRGDFALGGAVRIATGELDPANAPPEAVSALGEAASSGVAPVASFRYGVASATDLGVTVAGTLGRLDVRHEIVLSEDIIRFVALAGIGAYGGHMGGGPDDGAGARVGGDVPLVLGVDAVGLVSAYLGGRIGVEHAWGELGATGARQRAAVTGFRAGGLFGLALGFRHVHALFELSALYERWSGDVGGAGLEVEGFVLVPAFALRVRM
jgi:hypothetical protein